MTKVLIATYSQTGRTQRVADQLAKLVKDADQFQIRVAANIFSDDMFKTDAIATKQIETGAFPKLADSVGTVTDYDLILVGSPVWRGAPATPIHTFLKAIQDFQGKVATFYTDAGTVGEYERNFKNWAGKLNVVGSHEGSQNLAQWVQEL